MTHNRLRYLPLIVSERRAGMLFIADVMKTQPEASEFEHHYLQDYLQRQ
jgi:hypothetical protein